MMSMHVSQGKDYFATSNREGFWRSRTGLEQKLIIVASLLFCVCFALMITTIVLDKKLENYKSASSKDKTTTTIITSSTADDNVTTTVITNSGSDDDNITTEITTLSTNETSSEISKTPAVTSDDKSTSSSAPTTTNESSSESETSTSKSSTETVPDSKSSTAENTSITTEPKPKESQRLKKLKNLHLHQKKNNYFNTVNEKHSISEGISLKFRSIKQDY